MEQKVRQLIQETIPILQTSGEMLIKHFYERMFKFNPELRNVFNMTNQATGKQQNALANAVLAYAQHINDPSVLINTLKTIGHKHVSLNISKEQYEIVGNHLINSIKEILGDLASEDILNAWTIAYTELADIMIEIEADLYSKNTIKKGGWIGWRQFEIFKIEAETKEIKSFYFAPLDKKEIADFKPGQYISVKTKLVHEDLEQIRQYSLSSDFNENYYRVSIKKETDANYPDGVVSNMLHNKKVGDIIELSPPSGTFYLDIQDTKPMVLISGGIGQTPLLSMLKSNQKSLQKKKTIWIHACRNEQMHAFKKEIEEIQNSSDWLKTFFYYEAMGKVDNYATEGRIDLMKIQNEILIDEAKYYICGPAQFIQHQYNVLVDLGVTKGNIFYEEFGPSLLNLN
jgi:nitric oxide dioxygenase